MSDFDVIVIGGGTNGLTAAAYAAKRGRRTLLLERRDVLGGLAAGEEFHPEHRTDGVLHDTAGVRAWVARELDLERHGLVRRAEEPPVLLPATNGPGLELWRDPARTAAELAATSPTDGAAYGRHREFLARAAPVLSRFTDHAPPDLHAPGLGDLLQLGRSALGLRLLGKREMMELLRVVPLSLDDWLGEQFETPLLEAGLAAPALHHTYSGPRSPHGAASLLFAECTAGAPVAGGPRALVRALEAAARARGVEVRAGAAVERLLGESGRITGVRLRGGEEITAGAVAASCDPKHLFLDLVPPAMMPRSFERAATAYRARGTAAKVHLALAAYPDLPCRPGAQPAAIRIGEDLETLEHAFDAVKYRRFSERPILDVRVPTLESPDLAPEGHHVFSVLVHYVPYDLEGGWTDAQRENLLHRVLARLRLYLPGIQDAILGHELLTPVDLETRYGVTGGHLHHGEQALDQRLVRPFLGCARYATPFPGLYLCGSGAHPGGGLTCVPGALAAREICR